MDSDSIQYVEEYMENLLNNADFFQKLYNFSFSQIFSECFALIALLFFAYFTMGCKARKPLLVLSILWILFPIPVFITRNILLEEILSMVYFVIGIILLKLTFPKLRLPHLLFVSAFLLGFGSIAYRLVTAVLYVPLQILPTLETYALFLPTLLTAICVIPWIVLFAAKTRYRIREIITATPVAILVIGSILLLLLYYLNLMFTPHGFFYSFMHKVYTDSSYHGMLEVLLEDPQFENTPEMQEELMAFCEEMVSWSTDIGQAGFMFLLQLLLCVVVPVVMVITSSNKRLKKQNAEFEAQIQAQAEHYRELAEANAEVRRFRHDFKNLRFAIEKLLSDGKKDEALALMQEFGETLDSPNRQMMLFDTGNGIADALLTDKFRRAAQGNTTLTFQGAIPHNTPAPTDLCVLLGNSIDNAIEACEKLPESQPREISVECNCSSGFLFLTMRNPITGKVDIVDNRVTSSKKDKALHGFGIQSLHKVAKKYDGTVKLNADDGFFTVNIDLCLPA